MFSMRSLDSLAPISKYVPVVKADTDLPDGIARSLLVSAAGTLNLMQADGTIREGVPVQEGINPLVARQVRLGGTAQGVWALY
jgi:hypothetical protein